ncbi:hypothetical protein BASA61_008687 [Batrachochytrium salamandrivorans]|nr:hypothetical protein BASA62_007305 [Batrachochytrium salamandrivorans]KAH6567608.1 hypothetical protein BASA60_008968 [Batrachochytrium salamandrivorans]KAH6582061.1 hypothetical protein BASA61_008687 [Batrachochytrium salamandrivorans]KAH9268292.1 hypothetical protein BASA83_009453 [Batrachochytrium salamandrivorans]
MSAPAEQTAIERPREGGFILDPDTFKKIQPLEYHRRFIQEGVRADGRPLLYFRNPEFNTDAITSATGSMAMKLGETSVICAIKAELAEPGPTTPCQGYLVPNIDLPALCSPQYRSGPPSELVQSISTFLNSIIPSGDVLDLESLCVVPGRLVWVLYADIICLNYAGNVLDAAVAALMGALRNVKLPGISVDSDDIPTVNDEPPKHLKLNRAIISSTFAVFDEKTLLADPTHEEELLASSHISVVVDDKQIICGISKPGGVSVSKAILDECLKLAKERTPILLELIEQANAA